MSPDTTFSTPSHYKARPPAIRVGCRYGCDTGVRPRSSGVFLPTLTYLDATLGWAVRGLVAYGGVCRAGVRGGQSGGGRSQARPGAGWSADHDRAARRPVSHGLAGHGREGG